MPTRSVDNRVLQKAFDVLAPPANYPKQYLRWRSLARLTGLGEHWVRKRYQDRDRSELDIRSIERVRKALDSRRPDVSDEQIKYIVELLSSVQHQSGTQRMSSRPGISVNGRMRLRVVDVGFIRSSNANYCQRLEAGVRLGILDGLELTHLVNDESVDLSRTRTKVARVAAIQGLLTRFHTDPSYVDRTYLVPLGTVAAEALSSAMKTDDTLRDRLGKDLRIVFAGVTEPESTGLLGFSRDYIGGAYAGPTFADRLQFINLAFPDQRIAFLYDPELPQDMIARNEVLKCENPFVHVVKVGKKNPTKLPAAAKGNLVTGYTIINWKIHELVRDNPGSPFIGVNVSDLGRGAVLSTGNDDLQFGMECARRLLVPDFRNEINLRDMDIFRPAPVFGMNQKACNRYGLTPRIAARNRCQVVIE
jgi:hypothetical protein